MHKPTVAAVFTAIVSIATLTFAQEVQPPPQPPPPQPAPAPAPAPVTETAPENAPQPQVQLPPAPPPQPVQPQPDAMAPPSQQPGILSRAAGSSYDRRDTLPNVNIYLPEGQASVRLRKLIRNVLFESQIDYRFVNGDISTFLRYKYYAKNYTYKVSLFDSIGFPDITGSVSEFQRTRGGLLLFEVPRDYNHRYFALLEDDRLTFGDTTNVDNRKNNIYTKFSYQYGTQFDDHLNQIVGESRGQITPVLTAFRDIGPQKFSLAAAVTESLHISTGSYRYTKLEAEAIRRWDLTPTTFIVTRAHLGMFPTKSTIRGTDVPQFERYSIPMYEMFTIGGRDELKGIGTNDLTVGIDEWHVTNEYFVPVFRNRDFQTYALHWNTLYAIAYTGVGAVGFTPRDVGKPADFAVDAGLGFESSLTVRNYEVLLSVIYAHTVHAPPDLRGGKFRFGIRTIR